MKKILDLLISTSIMWLPILALYVATLLQKIITAEMIISTVKIIGLISLITLVVIERKEVKYEKRAIRKNR